jgi:hypothetical protein
MVMGEGLEDSTYHDVPKMVRAIEFGNPAGGAGAAISWTSSIRAMEVVVAP